MKILIFGISGQDGHYMKNLLQKRGFEVYGVSRGSGNWILGSVSDAQLVERLIKQYQPDFIFHFAANSTTKHDVLFENHESIVTGSLNILEACFKHSKHTRIFLSGSAVQFQNVGEPIDEATPFAALSPYAVSRIASVYAARYYRSLGLTTYVGYFFNHDSPLRTERHVNKKIAMAVQRIAGGSKEIIEIGNLETKKEFNFAGDIMKAIWMLVNQDIVHEAVIGSGKAYSIKDWIEICFQLKKMDWQPYIVKKDNFAAEYDILVSNPHLIRSIGWQPEVDIKGLAELMIKE